VPLVVWPAVDDDPARLMRSDDVERLIRRIAGAEDGSPPDLEPDELLLTEHRFRTYRRGQWKSLWPRGLDRAHLFDLVADPSERKDVARAHPDVVAAHRRRIEELAGRLTAPTAPTEKVSAADQARLRSLGYVRDAAD
jgi:hypothetical protein